jgi:lysozyme
MSYQISANGAALVEQFEGFIPHPYQKPGDVPTIGYGTTFYPGGKNVTLQDPWCTRPQAAEWLLNFMNQISLPVIEKYVTVPLNQNQVDSLADFIYNDGPGNFETSHLLQAINNNAGQDAITTEFMKWVYVNHAKSDWQVKRRTAEVNLYFS